MSCVAKTKCEVSKQCNPSTTIDINVVNKWINLNSQKCNINYVYIDSKGDAKDRPDVFYKIVNNDCHFHFTKDLSGSYTYVYSNLFEDVDYMNYNGNEYIIGHHITIGDITFDDGTTKFGFHSTVYNPKTLNHQYNYFIVDNATKQLKYVLPSGQTLDYMEPTPFLRNLWEQIKCGVQDLETKEATNKPKWSSFLKGGKKLIMVKATQKKPNLKKLYKYLDNNKLSISMFSSDKGHLLFFYEDGI